jgi:hypothetical protein
MIVGTLNIISPTNTTFPIGIISLVTGVLWLGASFLYVDRVSFYTEMAVEAQKYLSKLENGMTVAEILAQQDCEPEKASESK